MSLSSELENWIAESIEKLYVTTVKATVEQTKSDFEGDFTFVVFPILKISKLNPEQTAQQLGQYLIANYTDLISFNVIKGFLNLSFKQTKISSYANTNWDNFYFPFANNNQKVMVEFASPNTNKPLHLGHVRNILLGDSLSKVLTFAGNTVVKANLVNDRGIHICKSMLAWQKFGEEKTPTDLNLKGDHFVGKFYVTFEKELKKETDTLLQNIESNTAFIMDETKLSLILNLIKKENATTNAEDKKAITAKKIEAIRNATPIMEQARKMLLAWEANDAEIIKLWQTMNNWVYDGFNATYKSLNVNFDQFYYESDTYKLGKDLVEEGLQKNIFYKKEDTSVWIDLQKEGMDEKLVLRADGTSVYITQDMGTCDLKYSDYNCLRSIYVVGNEQDYHFKVLKSIITAFNRPYAAGIYHLSYGMVELPNGKMKSREGTVVDADELIADMVNVAKERTLELGKTTNLSNTEFNDLTIRIGLAALKFYLLKVDPKKTILFNPNESIDMQGDTGPFVLYTYARIKSILTKATLPNLVNYENLELHPIEKNLVLQLDLFKSEVLEASIHYTLSKVATYALTLARNFNKFYAELSVLKETDQNKLHFRINLCKSVANTLKTSLNLLGIQTVERM